MYFQSDLSLGTKEAQAGMLQKVIAANDTDAEEEREGGMVRGPGGVSPLPLPLLLSLFLFLHLRLHMIICFLISKKKMINLALVYSTPQGGGRG